MDANVISGRLLETEGGTADDVALSIVDGRIGTLERRSAAGLADRVLMAPIGNAHDHGRGVKPISLGAFDLPLELWLLEMMGQPVVDPYLVALAALGRQARGGVGSIMVHYTRPQNAARIGEELLAVSRAARAVGVRVAIALALRDGHQLGYRASEAELADLAPDERAKIRAKVLGPLPSIDTQIGIVEEFAAKVDDPLVTVQYGPYGLEWCSEPLLRRVAARSAETGRRVHMHLLESRLQREYLDSAFKQGPVRFLDEIGMLSPRLSVAHGVWLRPDEMDLLAERGVTVSTNASSNMMLRSGIAAVPAMYKHHVPLAMGLDGFTLDDDDDGFRELRLNYMLHRGVALDDGIPLSAWFQAACQGGRRVVTGRDWPLAAGQPADLLVLDYAAISRDVALPVDERRIIAQRATARHVESLFVDGREIVRAGRVLGVDLDGAQAELDAQVRRGIPGFRDWLGVSAKLRERLGRFYAAGLHRCG